MSAFAYESEARRRLFRVEPPLVVLGGARRHRPRRVGVPVRGQLAGSFRQQAARAVRVPRGLFGARDDRVDLRRASRRHDGTNLGGEERRHARVVLLAEPCRLEFLVVLAQFVVHQRARVQVPEGPWPQLVGHVLHANP
jgi:hypothetical protein